MYAHLLAVVALCGVLSTPRAAAVVHAVIGGRRSKRRKLAREGPVRVGPLLRCRVALGRLLRTGLPISGPLTFHVPRTLVRALTLPMGLAVPLVRLPQVVRRRAGVEVHQLLKPSLA